MFASPPKAESRIAPTTREAPFVSLAAPLRLVATVGSRRRLSQSDLKHGVHAMVSTIGCAKTDDPEDYDALHKIEAG
jgi:hypothetical protein